MENLKKSCKIVSDILELVVLAILAVLILTNNHYVGIFAVTLSAVSVFVSALGTDSYTPIEILKNMKLYFFIDALLFVIAKMNDITVMYYITIVIGVALLLVSIVFLFNSDEKESTKKDTKPKKKNNKKKKK